MTRIDKRCVGKSTTLLECLSADQLPMEPMALVEALFLALKDLHRVGRIVGNLHPGKVVVDAKGRCFFTSKPSSQAEPRWVAGCIYAAPEELCGRVSTKRSDVYSTCLIACKLLSSRNSQPTERTEQSHWPAAMQHALYGKPDLPLEVPPSLQQAIATGLDRRPHRRPMDGGKLCRVAGLERDLRPLLWQKRGLPPINLSKYQKVVARALSTFRQWLGDMVPKESVRYLDPKRIHLWAGLGVALLVLSGALLCTVWEPEPYASLREQVGQLLTAGRLDEARSLVGEALRIERHPMLIKLQGDVLCAQESYPACLQAYTQALDRSKRLGADVRLRDNLLALRSYKEHSKAVIDLLLRLDDKVLYRLEEDTQNPHYWIRWTSVQALEKRGMQDRIDYTMVWVADLKAGSCRTRRRAVQKLEQLGDPRALPYLEEAQQGKSWNLFEMICMGGSIERASEALRDKVAAEPL